MMTIYIDSDYKCHVTDDGTMTAVQTGFFNDKCNDFIEGYRFVPKGQSWTREDGIIFHGEMITPWKNYSELDSVQRNYERDSYLEYKEALKVMGVEI